MDAAEAAEDARRRFVADHRANERQRVVYYVQRRDGAIKVGVTSYLAHRLEELRRQFGSADLLAWHRGGLPAERAVQRRFSASRLDGEWFAQVPPLLAHIAHVAARRADNGSPRRPETRSGLDGSLEGFSLDG